MESPLKHFGELQDPRLPRTRRHLLADIVLIAIAAILSGAEGWDDMERYGKAKRDWLKSFLALPFGIPSHDTFNRVFQALDPAELEKQFLDWVSTIARRTQGEVVAIDGKSLRGTGSSDSKSLVHMVSAWASANNLVLDQRIAERGLPRAIRCDNGPELTSRHFLAWALDRKIDLVHIQPGKPTQNAYVESFNSKLREECLRVSWFQNLFEARRIIANWRCDYNERRPHSSLNYMTPSEFAAKAKRLAREHSISGG